MALSWEIWNDMSKAGRTLGAVLGVSYDSGAVLHDGTARPQAVTPVTEVSPSARPGSRAPRHWLDGNAHRLSTLDLCEGPFVLLSAARGWALAGTQAAARLRVPLVTRIIDDANWARLYEVSRGGAVLVQPDGYVAWRDTGPVEASAAVLEGVLRRVLALHSAEMTPSGATALVSAPYRPTLRRSSSCLLP